MKKTSTLAQMNKNNVKLQRDSRVLEGRISDAEAMVRLTCNVQLMQSADAERLRALAMRAFFLRSDGRKAIPMKQFRAYLDAQGKFYEFAAGLKPFVTKERQVRAAFLRFQKGTKGAKRR